MNIQKLRVLGAGAACALAAALAVVAAPTAATADVHWVVHGTFTDGGTLTGYFNINTYGYLSKFNLKTSTNSPFPGFNFTTPNNTNEYIAGGSAPGSSEATFFGTTYNGDQLVLNSLNPLDIAGPNQLLTTSFECQNSFSCPSAGDVRFLGADIKLGVPEPATWAMMLFGVGLIGVGVRMRRAPSVRAAVA